MKKLMIILSLCLACFGGIFLTACNEVLACQHSYTNCCDKSCDICGEERKVQISNIYELHEEADEYYSDEIKGKQGGEYVFRFTPNGAGEFYVLNSDVDLDATAYSLKIYDEEWDECVFEYDIGMLYDANGDDFLEQNAGNEFYFLIILNEDVTFSINIL